MHKFYWHNNSHAAGGSGGGGNGNGRNRARQQAGGSHGSSQQQQQQSAASLSPRVGRGGNASSSSCVAMRASDAPSVPHRNGVTVRVKTDNGGCENDDAKSVKSHAPSGSHRVLLKLRRMSGGGSGSSSRPKSVSDASEIPGSAVEIPAENPGSRMRGSRSMHQMFHYNKTWNERSLSKCLRETEQGGQHNYENIYSGDKDGANNEANPLYENVAYHQYQYPFVSLGNPAQGENSLVIGQLTKSPRSTARSRRNVNNNNTNGIFRSKSCERPKMRDAVRETQQHLVSNFNRLLQNRFGVGGGGSSNNNSGSALTTSASMFMGSDSSGYKSFHSGADDLQPQVRKARKRKYILSWIYEGRRVSLRSRQRLGNGLSLCPPVTTTLYSAYSIKRSTHNFHNHNSDKNDLLLKYFNSQQKDIVRLRSPPLYHEMDAARHGSRGGKNGGPNRRAKKGRRDRETVDRQTET